jgi:hypothetical protein
MRLRPARPSLAAPLLSTTVSALFSGLAVALFVVACGSGGSGGNGGGDGGSDGGGDTASTATTAAFQLGADFSSEAAFWSFPYPSDLRLDAKGFIQGKSFPNPHADASLEGLRGNVSQHAGFPVVAAAYFTFSAPIATQDVETVIAADAASNVLLIDVDPSSPDRGKLVPTVAESVTADDYVPSGVLAVAARPGFVLHPKRKYAYVVRRGLGDAAGQKLGVPADLALLASGGTPSGANGAAAAALYAPLWQTLSTLKIDPTDVAAATVFTTGDVTDELHALSDKVLGSYTLTIDNLAFDADRSGLQDRYCGITATITYPQFQSGMPPYAPPSGTFSFDASGMPQKQRDEVAPVYLTIPKGPMPAGGWPLVLYEHGSGGLSFAVVDRGTWHYETDPTKCPEGTLEMVDSRGWDVSSGGKTGCNTKAQGPAYILSPHGFATAGSALPVNPQRFPGAGETAYLNLQNLAAFRDTFRQGVIEQRLFLAALTKLQIPPSLLASCGATLPAGETAFHYAASPVLLQGQSMGGMYTNIIGSVEPKVAAVVPTGAGGYWAYFITKTPLYDNAAGLIASIFGADPSLTYLHPIGQLFETSSEVIDPMVAVPRLARRPLSGHPVRSIYEPVGLGDSYFPTVVYDAMALAYGNSEYGDKIWPTMQDALTLDGRAGLGSYPTSQNATSETGTKFTGTVIQYNGDGVYDPHAIYSQLDAVKYQYGCFFETFAKKGVATVPAPAALGTPCPGL